MVVGHTACNLVYDEENGKLGFIVFDYRSRDPKTKAWSKWEVRFPTGTNRSGECGESTEETSIRKLKEETGLETTETERIARQPAGEDHEKFAFLIFRKDCRSELRTTLLERNGDQMSIPYVVPVEDLRDKISPVHFWAYRAVVEKLRERGLIKYPG